MIRVEKFDLGALREMLSSTAREYGSLADKGRISMADHELGASVLAAHGTFVSACIEFNREVDRVAAREGSPPSFAPEHHRDSEGGRL